MVHILNKRLGKVIQEHQILKGENYTGLPGGCIGHPIHILNNLMEDMRQKKKEMWIVLQDMKKAFDSVSTESLDLAMKRIKIPEKGRTFIMDLFVQREIRIITHYGTTESVIANDGIDQGKVISSLLWRIFYNE